MKIPTICHVHSRNKQDEAHDADPVVLTRIKPCQSQTLAGEKYLKK
jgi:hypothetical protein